jgi:Tol biopolymer transport system component
MRSSTMSWFAVGIALSPATPGPSVQAEASVRALTQGAFASRAPAWSPDGGRIAFESDRDGRWGIYVLDVASGTVERLSSWDAHERRLAFFSRRDTAGGTMRSTDESRRQKCPAAGSAMCRR